MKEKNESYNIRFKPSLKKKVDQYIKNVNEHSEGTYKGTDFYNELLTNFFKDKVVTKGFIELNKLFYFNMNELKEKGVVKASAIKPIHHLESCFIVHKVPNNLDKWNLKYNSFSSDELGVHKGIYIYFNVYFSEKEGSLLEVADVKETYLIFRYNMILEELEISLINPEDVELYVDNPSIFLQELEDIKDWFYNNLIDEGTNLVNIHTLFYVNEVIESFRAEKYRNDFLKSTEGIKIRNLL